jgi:hypothetical protein
MKKEILKKSRTLTLEFNNSQKVIFSAFFLIGTITPPVVTKGFDPSKTVEIISYILQHFALLLSFSRLSQLFYFSLFCLEIELVFSSLWWYYLSSFCISSKYAITDEENNTHSRRFTTH